MAELIEVVRAGICDVIFVVLAIAGLIMVCDTTYRKKEDHGRDN